MATHDYVIANGTGAAVRSDLNGALAAIVSNNSGATEPGTMYAYQWWPDTTTGLLKIRNAANSAWVTVGTLASANLGLATLASPTFTGTPLAPTATTGTNTTQLATTAYVISQAVAKTGDTMTGVLAVTAGTAALPGIAVSGDLNTGITSPGADQLAISTGGTSRLAVSTTAVSSTLPVVHPLGAVGTPSITFTGDLNTGIYSPAADTLAASTAGTEQWRLSSSGDFSFNSGYGSAAVAYGCRAWVNFNGTGTVAIRASGNVSSITDNGDGDYTVNFTTAMVDANYSAIALGGNTAIAATDTIRSLVSKTFASSSLRVVNCRTDSTAADIEHVSVAIFR